MKIVLWGDRAVQFDAEAVHAMGAKEPVIAIFVGTLPKMSRGNCYNHLSFLISKCCLFHTSATKYI